MSNKKLKKSMDPTKNNGIAVVQSGTANGRMQQIRVQELKARRSSDYQAGAQMIRATKDMTHRKSAHPKIQHKSSNHPWNCLSCHHNVFFAAYTERRRMVLHQKYTASENYSTAVGSHVSQRTRPWTMSHSNMVHGEVLEQTACFARHTEENEILLQQTQPVQSGPNWDEMKI